MSVDQTGFSTRLATHSALLLFSLLRLTSSSPYYLMDNRLVEEGINLQKHLIRMLDQKIRVVEVHPCLDFRVKLLRWLEYDFFRGTNIESRKPQMCLLVYHNYF